MAHWQAHTAVRGQQAMARRGARWRSVPSDSPDLSPSAPGGSQVKMARRKVQARTRAMLETAIAEAMVTLSHADAWGWFTYCGYPVPSCANRSRCGSVIGALPSGAHGPAHDQRRPDRQGEMRRAVECFEAQLDTKEAMPDEVTYPAGSKTRTHTKESA